MCISSILSCFCPMYEIQNLLASRNKLKNDIQNDRFIAYSYQQIGERIYLNTDTNLDIKKRLLVSDNKNRYKKYKQALNNAINKTDKSIIKILQRLYSNLRNRANRQNKIQEPPTNLYLDETEINENIVKYFIFFFAADELYSELFHQQIRRNKYEQIAEIVALLRPHIAKQINLQERNKLLKQSNNLIYKPYERSGQSAFAKIKKMIFGEIDYFPSFLLVDLKQNESRTNAWATITVDTTIQHQFLAITPPFCRDGQNKFIVFPFLCFQIPKNAFTKTLNKENMRLKQIKPLE